MFDDSPLIRAVVNGSVLVIDEADKAPTHVTCVLKTLIETGEMSLADGRRIISHDNPRFENLFKFIFGWSSMSISLLQF